MGKPFVAPELEEVQSATPEKVDIDKASEVTIAGATAEVVNGDLTSIYKARIVAFKDFIEGKTFANDLEERGQEQLRYINFIDDMLNASYEVASACLDEFVKEVREYPNSYSDEKVMAPYWGMKVKPNKESVTPYINFIHFIIQFGQNIERKRSFSQGFDVTRFLNLWNDTQKENLYRFIYD